MLVSIFILILFLPAVCLPLALDTFFSNSELGDIGVYLETSDDTFPMHGYEFVGFLPVADNKDSEGCMWEISESIQTCS